MAIDLFMAQNFHIHASTCDGREQADYSFLIEDTVYPYRLQAWISTVDKDRHILSQIPKWIEQVRVDFGIEANQFRQDSVQGRKRSGVQSERGLIGNRPQVGIEMDHGH